MKAINQLTSAEVGGDALVVFGGTFDPPHEGHAQAISSLLAVFSTVVLAATEQNPWKQTTATPTALRIQMLRLLCEHQKLPLAKAVSDPGVVIFDFPYVFAEEVVNNLRAQCPKQIFWAVGEDIKDEVKRWKNWTQLNVEAVTVPIVIPVHATYVRSGTSPIHPALINFAKTHGLYGLF